MSSFAASSSAHHHHPFDAVDPASASAAGREYTFVNGGSHFRSERKSPALWNQFRDDIIRWYEQGGLLYMMQMMKRVHNFSATAGQFEYRLKHVWARHRGSPPQRTESNASTPTGQGGRRRGGGCRPRGDSSDSPPPPLSQNLTPRDRDSPRANSTTSRSRVVSLSPPDSSYDVKPGLASGVETMEWVSVAAHDFAPTSNDYLVMTSPHGTLSHNKHKRVASPTPMFLDDQPKKARLRRSSTPIDPGPNASTPIPEQIHQIGFAFPMDNLNLQSLGSGNSDPVSPVQEAAICAEDSPVTGAIPVMERLPRARDAKTNSLDSGVGEDIMAAYQEQQQQQQEEEDGGVSLFLRRGSIEAGIVLDVTEEQLAQAAAAASTSNPFAASSFAANNAITPTPYSNDILVVDCTLAASTYSQAEIERMALAADLLLALSRFDKAFLVHLVIWKRFRYDPANQWRRNQAMIACVRSAFAESHLKIARRLLETEVENYKKNDKKPTRAPRATGTPSGQEQYSRVVNQVLVYMLLVKVCRRQTDREGAKRFLELACLKFSDIHLFLTFEAANEINIDYMTAMYLSRCFSRCASDISGSASSGSSSQSEAHKFEQYLTERGSFTANLEKRKTRISLIRKCLNWAINQLSSAPDAFAPACKRILTRTSDTQGNGYAALVWLFWKSWYQQRQQDSNLAAQQADIEQFAGISVTEIFAVIAWMTTRIAISNNAPLMSVLKQVRNRSFLSRALTAAKTLRDASDESLGTSFLNTFSGQSYLAGRSNSSSRIGWSDDLQASGRGLAVEFAFGLLEMAIPDVLQLDETCIDPDPNHHPTDTVANDAGQWHSTGNKPTSLASSLYDPPFAPSVHSSNMSSLRRLAERIKRDNSRRGGGAGVAATIATATESRPNSVFSSSFSRQSWVSSLRRDFPSLDMPESSSGSGGQMRSVTSRQQQRDEMGALTRSLVSLSTQGYEKPVSPS